MSGRHPWPPPKPSAELSEAEMTYDEFIQQPTVLGPEASRRFLEIMAMPRVPLIDPPIPLRDEDDGAPA